MKAIPLNSAIALALTLTLLLTGCGRATQPTADPASESSEENAYEGLVPEPFLKPLNIAYISQFTDYAHEQDRIKGVRAMAEQLGMIVDVMDAENDLDKMTVHIRDAVSRQVDGILISHGLPEKNQYAVQEAVDAGIPIVAMDLDLPLEGMTIMDQDDEYIAEIALEHLVKDIDYKGNLVYIWVDGYTPFIKRDNTYQRLMPGYPDVVEIAKFGDATAVTALDTQVDMSKVLEAFPGPDGITAVWAPWDEYGIGASKAIMEAGRDEIKVYSVDVSNVVLEWIQNPESPWVATTGIDPILIGKVQTRILAYKIAGKETPDYYAPQPYLISRDMLPTDTAVTMDTLHQYVDGWGQSDDFTDDWLQTVIEMNEAQ